MKKMTWLVALVTLISGAAWADFKVGYVDMQRALGEVYEGQAAKARLKADMDRKKQQFQSEENKLRDDMALLEKQRTAMSEETLKQKQLELQKRVYDLAQKGEKMQVDLSQAEHIALKGIIDKMDAIIRGIAEREGLTFVFERTDSGLIYAPPSLDLTNELVRAYNAKFPKTASAKKSGSGPRK